MTVVRIAVVGYGYWGPNLVRNIHLLPDADLAVVCDLVPKRLADVTRTYPAVMVTDKLDDVLNDPSIDAVIFATPAATHHRLGKMALERGKHVMVEKPLAMSVRESEDLIRLAEENQRVLMVGHTFEYNDAIRWLKQYVDAGNAGDIFYMYAQRLNLGQIRQDVNVMWNLAPHDISILNYLSGMMPLSVTAQGRAYIQPEMEDVTFLTMEFPNGLLGHVHVSWMDPQKVRRATLVGSKKMVMYDDVSVDARIQVYDKGIDILKADNRGDHANLGEFQLLLRSGDLLIPRIDYREPLRLECQEFVDSIREGRVPLTDGYNGLRVVKVLEAAQHSLRHGGVRVHIS